MSIVKSTKVTRVKLQSELKRIHQDFIKQFPDREITRDYYRKNSAYPTDAYTTYYPDFDAFKTASLGAKETPASAKATPQAKPTLEPLPIDRRVEIEKEKITSKTSEWKQKFEHVFAEHELLKKQFEALADLKKRESNPSIITPRTPSGNSESVAVALLSDWHSEEKVTKGQTSGRNEFNKDICTTRIEKCFQGIQRMWEINNRDTQINTMILALLGDFISGSIHEDLAEANEFPPSEAIYRVQNHIVGGIKFLLKETGLEKIIIPCHSGNHGRMTKEQRIATETGNSLEQYMYYNLSDLFADEERVKFQIADGYHSYINVFGTYKIRFHHGHNLRYGGGVGGIYIPVNKAINEWNKLTRDVRLDCFGHFHQFLDAPNFVANGSLIGYNAYANSVKAAYERPKQAFFLINKKYNEKTIAAPILLTDGDDSL